MDYEKIMRTINDRLYAVDAAILDKTGENPALLSQLSLWDGKCYILSYGLKSAKYDSTATKLMPSIDSAFAEMHAMIAALPDPENIKLHEHMKRVAACVDAGEKDGIDAQYITPLRMTVQAISSNLLPAPGKS